MLNMRICPDRQLSKTVGNRRIVCFGAGRNFSAFLNAHRDLKGNIICILDNDKSLSGTTIEGLPICLVDNFMQESVGNFILMITSANYAYEIVSQLDQMKIFDGIDAYIYAWNCSYPENCEIEFLKGEQKIPKIIHYGWFGGSPIPKHLQAYIDTWKRFCPDYQIIRWDESNYDVSKNLYMKQAYEVKKYAFVSDYMRLDVVKNYGGIYLDTDVELLKSLDDLLCYDFYCGFEFPHFNSAVYGARCGHPLLNKLLQPYENMCFIHNGVLNETPCTIYITQVLVAEGFCQEDIFQLREGIALFPREVFYPGKGVVLPGIRGKNTFSIHHYDGSWGDKRQADQFRVERKNLAELYAERIGASSHE